MSAVLETSTMAILAFIVWHFDLTQHVDSPENAGNQKQKKPKHPQTFRLFRKTGGNLLSRKLYNHYHRQGCV
jgi:hypothetical protein